MHCTCGAPLTTCPDCDGTGRVGPEGESWKHWMDLPLGSAVAVVAGIVKPRPCPACKGGGLRYIAPAPRQEDGK